LSTVADIDTTLAGEAPVEAMLSAERFCYLRAQGYRAAEESVVERIESDYGIEIPRSGIGFIPHGMADTTVGVRPERVEGAVNVLFVGRLEKRKGIDVLLECIPSLLSTFPDVVFTIVGDDTVPGDDGVPFRTAFENSDAGNLDLDRVTFAGVVEDLRREALYAGCDVFVAPSRSESFGLILLEAMMFGKPVVAGDNGGMRSIVIDGGNGYLVPPGDAAALHGALASLIGSSELRREMGFRSREIFEERFCADRMVRATNRFYDRLLGRDTADRASQEQSMIGVQ
jgi:glycogen synthase